MDDERLLAHGRHRVRHRQAAARAGGREHPRRRDADVPQSLGEHPQGHAQEGARQGRGPRSARAARSSCRRRSRRSTATTRRPSSSGQEAGITRAALLHHRLPEHRHLEAGLRLHLRLPARERGRHHHAGERPPGALPQLRRARQPARRAPTRCSSTASSSKPAMRSTTTSAAWPPTRSSASAARSSSAPATRAQARTSPTRTCCARS